MEFEIESFRQFKPGGNAVAGFSLSTDDGMYYDCKLVRGGDLACGHFVATNQSRSYKKNDGDTAYIKAFGAKRGTPAAELFNDVAEEATKKLKKTDSPAEDPGRPFTAPNEPFDPNDDVPF